MRSGAFAARWAPFFVAGMGVQVAVLVVAGSGRGAGKTAVSCAVMAAMPEFSWLAVKVTSHRHDVDEGLWEELDFRSEKDTGRYLKAGARRAFLLSGERDLQLSEFVTQARVLAAECNGLLVESNQIAVEWIARRGEPAMRLAVLAGVEAAWKPSLLEMVEMADALVLTEGLLPESLPPEWRRKRSFYLRVGEWLPLELLNFIRERMQV